MLTCRAVSFGCSLLLAAGTALAQSTLTEIPLLPGNNQQTVAYAVSGDGLTVSGACGQGTSTLGPTSPVPILWTASGGTVLLPGSGTQPNPSGYAYAVSADGQYVAGRLGQTNVYRWDGATGVLSLPTIPGTTMMIALGISSDGSAVVGHSLNSPTKPYRWTAAGGTVVLPGGETGGTARAVNGDGSIVAGGLLVEFQTYATRWVDEGGGHLFHLNGACYGMNPSGDIVVGHVTPPGGVGRAYRWTFDGETNNDPVALDLGTIPGVNEHLRKSEAKAVNNDGTVIVGLANRHTPATPTGPFQQSAFIWRDGQGMMDLNTYAASLGISVTGWDLRVANGVSGDGKVIVGAATLNGIPKGFVLRVAPDGPLCCTSDFDGDGAFGQDSDIEAFFLCLGGHCCLTCWPAGADFNGDGASGQDNDIESFFLVLGGGGCV